MERKPRRRTRARILEAGLRLFNEFGEPNVTTARIADELGISPGNLYYHFRNKEEIVNDLFAGFARQIDETLAAPARAAADVEDLWLFLHLLFELTWKYRFLFRDLNDLISRNRTLELRLKAILEHELRTLRAICEALEAKGQMRAGPREIEAAATNMVVVATYWLSFEYVRDPRHPDEARSASRGIYQVMSLIAPMLIGRGRALFDRLAVQYISDRGVELRSGEGG
ncbi:MAG TPA: TetR family transcriptional regulator [Rhodocyclaceae bacterium]|nr:MAG: TetR family transcriptional regulator [Betaproteobacteria bacterium CG2_30_68_42]PIV76559.1 MAG: TetR family transcriptional regulator [Rhodocyclales bacterium CG17_big_fil_post_rev_8_21_14_2_50_68_7]PIX75297.1 MAG: TetR family transcriptional regulator [Rhodocyclales bacterium CG_4_10_14_3_um_filter_68_10]PJA57040.1 MAG: TetR family transcriptional regulator [Rhodocyclales bacterium CG_4_9_14_3_um_filter_68_10]HCX33482.1 TetR family transcriptional regulator [Rhodocyclaceae bacterium]